MGNFAKGRRQRRGLPEASDSEILETGPARPAPPEGGAANIFISEGFAPAAGPFSDWWTDDWQDRWDAGVVGVPKCWIVSFLGTQICHLGSLGTPFLHPGDIFVRCWAPHLKGTSIEVGLLPQAGHSGVHIEIYMDLGWILGVHWDLLCAI